MLITYHNEKNIIELQKNGQKMAVPTHDDLIDGFEKIASEFPDELLIWCHVKVKDFLNVNKLDSIFHHNGIMASYSFSEKKKIHRSIGYIDTTPFIKIPKELTYPTWLMSVDAGGVNTTVITNFGREKKVTSDFELYLNLMARKGMWQGLTCYSEPTLLTEPVLIDKKSNNNSYAMVFQFVKFHYKTQWLFFLFILIAYYDKKLPVAAFLKGLFFLKSNPSVNCMEGIKVNSTKKAAEGKVDVLIPTIGRKKYLYDFLIDLKNQTHLPDKVIIVEQNPLPKSVSELDYLKSSTWPFRIEHVFTHQSGACNARNIALDKVSGDWVFFADDDIRIGNDFIEKGLQNLQQYGQQAASFFCYRKGDKPHVFFPLQWWTFGSGCSIVQTKRLHGIRFDMRYEFGFGEDGDFGIQLRNSGTDVLYFPKPDILHLKAPIGGFRSKSVLAWEKESIQPKPSPTVLLFQIKNLTLEQQRSEKVRLFINYYKHQPIKNPLLYIKTMKKKWKVSRKWALKLMNND